MAARRYADEEAMAATAISGNDCTRCDGTGEVRKALRWFRRRPWMRPCPECRGKLGRILPPRV
jgi:DnaJ-class molecular chaperone